MLVAIFLSELNASFFFNCYSINLHTTFVRWYIITHSFIIKREKKSKSNVNKPYRKCLIKMKHVSAWNLISCLFDFIEWLFTINAFLFIPLTNFRIEFFPHHFHEDLAKSEIDTVDEASESEFEYEVADLSDSQEIESNVTSSGTDVRIEFCLFVYFSYFALKINRFLIFFLHFIGWNAFEIIYWRKCC